MPCHLCGMTGGWNRPCAGCGRWHVASPNRGRWVALHVGAALALSVAFGVIGKLSHPLYAAPLFVAACLVLHRAFPKARR